MRILDKNYLLTTEASTRFRIHYFDICDENQKAKYLELSINNFAYIKNIISSDEIGLLGTGPSFEIGKEIFSKERLSIITCNSAI